MGLGDNGQGLSILVQEVPPLHMVHFDGLQGDGIEREGGKEIRFTARLGL